MNDMPKMHDMECSEEEKDEKETLVMDKNKYPYGLVIRLTEDEISKLKGLEGINVGSPVMIVAEGNVISESMRGNDEEREMEIQIKKIGISLKTNKKPEEMTMKEYKEYVGSRR